MKTKGQNFEIKWSIIRRRNPYKAGSKKCNLRLWEKFHIMTEDKDKLLNERGELITKCRHVDKCLLKNYKSRRRGRGRGKGKVFLVGVFVFHVCFLCSCVFFTNLLPKVSRHE